MKYYILTSVVSLAVGAFTALKLRPPVVKTEIREVVKTNTVVRTKREKMPDGRIVTETTRETNKQETRQKSKNKPAKDLRPNYIVSFTHRRNFADPTNQAVGVAVQKRVLADVYLYGAADVGGQITIGIGLGF